MRPDKVVDLKRKFDHHCGELIFKIVSANYSPILKTAAERIQTIAVANNLNTSNIGTYLSNFSTSRWNYCFYLFISGVASSEYCNFIPEIAKWVDMPYEPIDTTWLDHLIEKAGLAFHELLRQPDLSIVAFHYPLMKPYLSDFKLRTFSRRPIIDMKHPSEAESLKQVLLLMKTNGILE